jgi:hypothetical protein
MTWGGIWEGVEPPGAAEARSGLRPSSMASPVTRHSCHRGAVLIPRIEPL